ncbi:MAG TPA: porin [Candidatus Binatia bacterium]|nr:porin [Candidatus Binatia bacterium]
MKKNTLTKVALAALATVAGASAAQAQTAAPSHTTSWTGTVGEDRYGDARFKLRGRFQYDIASSEWDIAAGDDGFSTYVRRAFIGAQGRLTENWRYKIDFVLDPGNSGATSEVGVDDAYLEYVTDDWSILIGEHNITSPLEDRISSLDIPLIERSAMINAFGYGRLAGLGFLTGGHNWSVAAALQGDSLNDNTAQGTSEQTAVSGRVTFAPIFSTTPEGVSLIHLGLHARSRSREEDASLAYSVRPQNGRSTSWINPGIAAEEDVSYGGEAALQFGPFGAHAEYTILQADDGVESYDLQAYYVDFYWSLTGESRSYRANTGSFGAIAPRRPFGEDGGLGHWMLSARYDYADLSEGPGAGRGEQTAYAIGLDWVPIDHFRFKLNFADTEMDRAVGADAEAQIVTLRTQFDF